MAKDPEHSGAVTFLEKQYHQMGQTASWLGIIALFKGKIAKGLFKTTFQLADVLVALFPGDLFCGTFSGNAAMASSRYR